MICVHGRPVELNNLVVDQPGHARWSPDDTLAFFGSRWRKSLAVVNAANSASTTEIFKNARLAVDKLGRPVAKIGGIPYLNRFGVCVPL
jgi:hypothetical protein